ncbi:hypothetical protein ACHMXE_30815 [Variovorax sp. UC122_21]
MRRTLPEALEMQQISRMHVSHFGSPTAWYDSHVFALNDPDTDDPTDTVFNLENAGGKTSLLSYIFSCFDPKQDRWLQHLQKSNHRFQEYFSRDGRPSFILIEWCMPGRSAGAPDYKLLIGQAVTIKDTIERGAEADRWFFAFEVADGLSMNDVPAPGLSGTPCRSMPEFVQWMQEASSRSRGDFFRTKNQDDWVKHLGGVRMLDIELLRMQVDFNSNEGGMEEGFLTFNSEADLLRRFLILTLDPERSATVRDALAHTADKLKSRPRYEKQLEQLNRLHAVMLPFVDAAAAYQSALEEHEATRRHAASLAASLRCGSQEKEAEALVKRGFATDQDGIAETGDKNARYHQDGVVTMKGLQLDRKAAVALAAKEDAEERSAEGEQRLQMLRGSKALGVLTAKTEAANSLQAMMELEEEGLKPAQHQAEVEGALLDSALASAQASEAQRALECSAAETKAKQRLEGIATEEREANNALQRIASEKGQHEGFETAYQQQHQRLVAEQLLDIADGSVATAIERHAASVVELEAQLAGLDQQIEELNEEERQHREGAAEFGAKAALAKAAQDPLEKLLASGQALRDSIAQMEVMRIAADAELADADEPTLLEQLDALIAASEEEISGCDVLLAQLSTERSSILETGLAGRSADVDAAVKQLTANGIRSARAASSYIADMLPDEDQAKPVVLSDPARFLGVSIAEGDWAKLVDKLPDLKVKLRAPVTVAVQSLEAKSTIGERLVLAPEDAALFNKSAAQVALGHLDKRIVASEDQRRAYQQRKREGNEGRAKLVRYQTEFGAVRLRQADAELEEKRAEETAARTHQEELSAKALACKKSAEQVSLQRKPLPARIESVNGGIRQLRSFQRDYESKRPEIQRRMLELQSQARVQTDLLADLARQRVDVDTNRQSSNLDRVRHEANATKHGTDRAAIDYIDKKYPADEHLRAKPQALDSLRMTYAHAVEVLRARQSDRDPMLAERLRSAQAARKDSEAAFQEFAAFDEQALRALLGLDFEAELRDQAILNERLGRSKEAAVNDHVSIKTERELYWAQHKLASTPTPDLLALNDVALVEQISASEQEAAAASQMAERARKAAAGSRARAGEADLAAARLKSLNASLAAAVPWMTEDYDHLVLPPDFEEYTNSLIHRHRDQRERVDAQREKARSAFQSLSAVASSKDLVDVEAELARDISDSNFDHACSDRLRVLELTKDRIVAVQDTLDTMEPDIQNSVGELYNLTFEGMSMLTRACGKTMPAAAPYVGGKHIITMKARFQGISVDARKEAIRKYFSKMIEKSVVPAKGADLVAQSLVEISGGQDLGIKVLKMEQNEAHQYQLASELKGSKGQGTVIAMFLYLLISQLRADTQASAKRAGGGPLILDNPFAKVQTRALIDAQRLLAKEIGVQLIFFTANADANILAGFRRVIRLRKSHMNSRSQRSHIEMVSATFTDMTSPEAPT